MNNDHFKEVPVVFVFYYMKPLSLMLKNLAIIDG